jgi:hypothetical protein
VAGLKQLNWASEGVGATAAALVDLSTVAGNKISNPPWVKFQSAGWVNFPSAPTVCGQLNERLSAATRKVGDLAFLDITGRIVSVIQDLVHASFAVKASEGTVIPITRQDLGRLASCSRETAGRVLKLLEEQGLIICSGRNITVLKA